MVHASREKVVNAEAARGTAPSLSQRQTRIFFKHGSTRIDMDKGSVGCICESTPEADDFIDREGSGAVVRKDAPLQVSPRRGIPDE